MRSFVKMMMEYNRWANERLLADCGKVDATGFHTNFGVEHHSIHGTLDHALQVDRIWLARFNNQNEPCSASETLLTLNFSELAEQRRHADEDLTSFTDYITEIQLTQCIRFKTDWTPVELHQPLGSAFFHVFHHQGHYRAQAQALVQMLGLETQALDFLHFQQHTGLGAVAML